MRIQIWKNKSTPGSSGTSRTILDISIGIGFGTIAFADPRTNTISLHALGATMPRSIQTRIFTFLIGSGANGG